LNKHLINGLKLILVIGMAYYIYHTLYVKNDVVELSFYVDSKQLINNLWWLIVALCLVIPNWLFEALKWREVINQYSEITLYKSFISVLAGLSLGILTPARTGEYLGRLTLLEKEQRGEATLSTFVGSLAQNLVTVIIGISIYAFYHSGVFQELERYSFWINITVAAIVILGPLVYFNLSLIIKYLGRITFTKKYVNKLQSQKVSTKGLLTVLIYAFIRYIIYCLQYLCILKFIGLQANAVTILASIPIIYLFQSLLPLPPLSGLLARGEISILVLSVLDNNIFIILLSALILWVINLIIPALCGMIVLLNFNKSN